MMPDVHDLVITGLGLFVGGLFGFIVGEWFGRGR
jgi:hypothetical protein